MPFVLRVYLDEVGRAEGALFWDDGDSIGADSTYLMVNFNCRTGRLKATPKKAVLSDLDLGNTNVEQIDIFGVKSNASRVTVNGREVPFHYLGCHRYT